MFPGLFWFVSLFLLVLALVIFFSLFVDMLTLLVTHARIFFLLLYLSERDTPHLLPFVSVIAPDHQNPVTPHPYSKY